MELTITQKNGKTHTVLYDECDHELISKYTWCINKYGYASAQVRISVGKRKTVLMHRIILGVTDPKVEVDHIRHNRLDNRRSEIRACSLQQNRKNKSATRGRKFVGVTESRPVIRGKAYGPYYTAKLCVDKKIIRLGSFPTEEAAVRARDAAVKIYIGEFANLNFPG